MLVQGKSHKCGPVQCGCQRSSRELQGVLSEVQYLYMSTGVLVSRTKEQRLLKRARRLHLMLICVDGENPCMMATAQTYFAGRVSIYVLP